MQRQIFALEMISDNRLLIEKAIPESGIEVFRIENSEEPISVIETNCRGLTGLVEYSGKLFMGFMGTVDGKMSPQVQIYDSETLELLNEVEIDLGMNIITDFCPCDEDANIIMSTHQKGFMTLINTENMELLT